MQRDTIEPNDAAVQDTPNGLTLFGKPLAKDVYWLRVKHCCSIRDEVFADMNDIVQRKNDQIDDRHRAVKHWQNRYESENGVKIEYSNRLHERERDIERLQKRLGITAALCLILLASQVFVVLYAF